MKNAFESVPVLIGSLLIFVVIFATFLFFNNDVVAKVLMCSFSGLLTIVLAWQLVKVTRRN